MQGVLLPCVLSLGAPVFRPWELEQVLRSSRLLKAADAFRLKEARVCRGRLPITNSTSTWSAEATAGMIDQRRPLEELREPLLRNRR